MTSFHRTRKESRILGFVGLTLALLISIFFMLIGFANIQTEKWNPLQLVFGVAGLSIFVVFIRGSWMSASGAVTHIFNIDSEKVTWGFIGKEKSMMMKDVSSIYWDESDGFDLSLYSSEGRIVIPYAQNIISHKSRATLLSYLIQNFPAIDIDGQIDKNTEQEAPNPGSATKAPIS